MTIQWYWCPTGAQQLGVHHQYGSLNWTKGIAYPDEVGETIGGIRLYQKGITPIVVGTNHCGSADQWMGIMHQRSTNQPINEHGVYACCADPGVVCSHCFGGFGEVNMPVIGSGATGRFTFLNGTNLVPTSGDGTCEWLKIGTNWSIRIFWLFPFFRMDVNLLAPLGNARYNSGITNWDCKSQHTWRRVSATEPGSPAGLLVG